MAATFVPFVESYSIPGHQSAHNLAEGSRAGAQEEVKMVRDQGPGIALGLGFFEDICQAVKEGVAVLVVSEKFPPFNSPGHDVLE